MGLTRLPKHHSSNTLLFQDKNSEEFCSLSFICFLDVFGTGSQTHVSKSLSRDSLKFRVGRSLKHLSQLLRSFLQNYFDIRILTMTMIVWACLGHSTAKVVMKCKVFNESKEKPSCVRTTYSTWHFQHQIPMTHADTCTRSNVRCSHFCNSRPATTKVGISSLQLLIKRQTLIVYDSPW